MSLVYLLACVIAVVLIFIYLWGSRRNHSYKPLSVGARCVCFITFVAVGVVILWHLHDALEAGRIQCSVRYSPDRICTQEEDAIVFTLRWLFLFIGGSCGVASGIFLLVRSDPEDEER